MKLLRLVLASGFGLLLIGGYLASQWPWLTMDDPRARNEALARYARAVDQPSVRALAWALLVGGVAIGFLPRTERDA